jgi:hypothetical protein
MPHYEIGSQNHVGRKKTVVVENYLTRSYISFAQNGKKTKGEEDRTGTF